MEVTVTRQIAGLWERWICPALLTPAPALCPQMHLFHPSPSLQAPVCQRLTTESQL